MALYAILRERGGRWTTSGHVRTVRVEAWTVRLDGRRLVRESGKSKPA